MDKENGWKYTLSFNDGTKMDISERDFEIFLTDPKVFNYLIYEKNGGLNGWSGRKISALEDKAA